MGSGRGSGWDDGFWIGLNCQSRGFTGSPSVFLHGDPEETFTFVFASTTLTLPLRLSVFFSCAWMAGVCRRSDFVVQLETSTYFLAFRNGWRSGKSRIEAKRQEMRSQHDIETRSTPTTIETKKGKTSKTVSRGRRAPGVNLHYSSYSSTPML